MERTKHKRLSKVYKPQGSLSGLLFALVFMLFHFLLLISAWGEEFTWVITFILLPLYAFGIWEIFIEATQTSITLYDDGIEWQRGGSKLFTTWDNVSHIGQKGKDSDICYGIYLYEKVKPTVNGLIESLALGRRTDFIPLSGLIEVPTDWSFRRDTFIDFDTFSQSDFGHDLMYYAPHLFEKGKAKPKHQLSDEGEVLSLKERLRYENRLSRDLEQVES